MLALPPSTSNRNDLADWVELNALASSDGNCSASDLRTALTLMHSADESEVLTLSTFDELTRRAVDCQTAYPFDLTSPDVLQTTAPWETHVEYVFCLCLSYFGRPPRAHQKPDPYRLFEELSCVAASAFVSGESCKFGAGVRGGRQGFAEAVNELCRRIGEGERFGAKRSLRRKDDKVDLVAWNNSPDQRPGKILLFGQCAAGKNWLEKVDSLNPEEFWNQWIVPGRLSRPLKSFYVPHRIELEMWDYYTRYGGILFDRCRIAFWASRPAQRVTSDPRFSKWCRIVYPAIA